MSSRASQKGAASASLCSVLQESNWLTNLALPIYQGILWIPRPLTSNPTSYSVLPWRLGISVSFPSSYQWVTAANFFSNSTQALKYIHDGGNLSPVYRHVINGTELPLLLIEQIITASLSIQVSSATPQTARGSFQGGAAICWQFAYASFQWYLIWPLMILRSLAVIF